MIIEITPEGGGEICAFCGRDMSEVYIESELNPDIKICETCLTGATLDLYHHLKADGMNDVQIFRIIQQGLASDAKYNFRTQSDYQTDGFKLTPQQIVDKLGETVIGQDAAKKVLAVAAYNHYKKIGYEGDINIDTSNVIIAGPTGTGKTFLIEQLSKILNVPMTIADATMFTERGYIGDSVDDILQSLFVKTNYNIEACEKAIIFIDEIDKIARDAAPGSKDMGLSVQQNLLKLLEGGEINVRRNLGNGQEMVYKLNTTNILFITSGAFVGIAEGEVTHDSLQNYGLIPEILGRLPIITQTYELTEDDMVRILKDSKSSLVKQYEVLFEQSGYGLEFTDSALKAVANMALDNNIGARGLRTVVEKIMLDLSFKAPSIQNLEKCLIDYDGTSISRKFITQKTAEAE